MFTLTLTGEAYVLARGSRDAMRRMASQQAAFTGRDVSAYVIREESAR